MYLPLWQADHSNVQPGLTIIATGMLEITDWDWSSHLVQDFHGLHVWMSCFSHLNFSSGNLISIVNVSIKNPRKSIGTYHLLCHYWENDFIAQTKSQLKHSSTRIYYPVRSQSISAGWTPGSSCLDGNDSFQGSTEGALIKPNSRQVSMTVWIRSCHCIPNKFLSTEWTGILWYPDLISNFPSIVPWPALKTGILHWSIGDRAGLFTCAPSADDKSTISCHFYASLKQVQPLTHPPKQMGLPPNNYSLR